MHGKESNPWQKGDMHGRGCVWRGGGMCAGETATEAGGTHPTEMHSCCIEQRQRSKKKFTFTSGQI